jgi:signal peptidase II
MRALLDLFGIGGKQQRASDRLRTLLRQLVDLSEYFVKRNIIVFILGAVAVTVLDQITKTAISSRFLLHESYEVINGLFNLVYVMNPGAAFGFLAGASATFRYIFFIGITVIAMLLIIYYLVKSQHGSIVTVASLTLIFAGAVGNLIDRIRFGAVVDFLDVYIGAWHWPAFNVADSAITVGAALMIWEMVTGSKKRNLS